MHRICQVFWVGVQGFKVPEDRNQRSEIRNQRSEIRGQRSEVSPPNFDPDKSWISNVLQSADKKFRGSGVHRSRLALPVYQFDIRYFLFDILRFMGFRLRDLGETGYRNWANTRFIFSKSSIWKGIRPVCSIACE